MNLCIDQLLVQKQEVGVGDGGTPFCECRKGTHLLYLMLNHRPYLLAGDIMFHFERNLYIFIIPDDSLCDDVDGDCEWKDDGCSGEWSPGKCAGPADRVCCVKG